MPKLFATMIFAAALTAACATTQSSQKRRPAAENVQGCGIGKEVGIEFPKGLNIPGDLNDKLSKDFGVPTIALRGVGTDGAPKGVICTIANESGKTLSISPNGLATALVGQTPRGGNFFVDKEGRFQLSCDNIEGGDSIPSGEIRILNESLREHIVVHSESCISML